MAFTENEIAEYATIIEEHFWAHRRPPLHLRDQIREGQRFADQSIELFFVRPVFRLPDQWVEDPIAKIKFIRNRKVWQLFWKRADNQWHRYPPNPEAESLAAALSLIHEDVNACFFG
jgi:hypothetical protein